MSAAVDRFRREITLAEPIGPGKSAGARLVQEYLAINGLKLVIDGDWGSATQHALSAFAPGAKAVDQALMNRLARPILQCLADVGGGSPLAETIVAVAQQHLRHHPVEVGGANAGPFVRLYMDGNQGSSWPWCMGFATLIVQQAGENAGIAVPAHLKRSYSCDEVGAAAKKAGKLVAGSSSPVTAGSLFLVRGAKSGDWIHTGIIAEVHPDTFVTIEGNTNDEGSRDGYEVCQRIRNRKNLDAVLV